MMDHVPGTLSLSSFASRCMNKSRQVSADFENKFILRHLLLGELPLVVTSLCIQVMNESNGPHETEQ